MAGRKVAISNCARALNDNEIYIIQIFDNAPSGLLVKAYLQAKSLEYFMPITEGELEKAALNRGEAALTRLAESIDLVEKGGAIFLESSIPGIAKPKVVPSGAPAAATTRRARGRRRRTPQATACASRSPPSIMAPERPRPGLGGRRGPAEHDVGGRDVRPGPAEGRARAGSAGGARPGAARATNATRAPKRAGEARASAREGRGEPAAGVVAVAAEVREQRSGRGVDDDEAAKGGGRPARPAAAAAARRGARARHCSRRRARGRRAPPRRRRRPR
ncbi:hypothetical protein SO694_00128022 [Aureococcus anophagefferens]|uniref:Uncharacterized protein n=1 Tax=Aureococcus anophagefferens TaxID=44056 RepID=A0ABR1G4Z2_AURAN